MESLISVVIPTIGRESLKNVLDSVLSQTYQTIEIILIDDSIEQNIEISALETKIRLLKTGGGKGVSAARNIGILSASGDFISFLDDDDIWFPDKVKNQLEFMLLNQIDGSFTSAYVGKKLRRRPKVLLQEGVSPLRNLYSFKNSFMRHTYLPTPSFMVKLQVIREKELLFNESLIAREDITYFQDLFDNGLRISQSTNFDVWIGPNATFSTERASSRTSIESDANFALYLWNYSIRYTLSFVFFTTGRMKIARLGKVKILKLSITIIKKRFQLRRGA